MYASVHADRSGRVLVSEDLIALGMGGSEPLPLIDAIPLPAGARLVPLAREAEAHDRAGRVRGLGKGRLALGALLPGGSARLLFPAYRDEPAAPALDALPYAAVAADERGELVVAAADMGGARADHGDGGRASIAGALRDHPANALVRQLARCARDHECRAAAQGLGHAELPVPLGAAPSEQPRLPLDLRSGYAGSPTERAAFRPSAREIVEMAVAHAGRGGSRIGFGRACDGEPLRRIRVLEEAIAGIRERAPSLAIHLETSGSDPAGLRRAIDAGLGEVSVRLASARAETYEPLHAPIDHRWGDVRACLLLAAERSVAISVALLVLPGLADRSTEIDAVVELLGELPGGRLELRDLGADPLRVLAAFPRAPALGVRVLIERLAEADHFRLGSTPEAAAV